MTPDEWCILKAKLTDHLGRLKRQLEALGHTQAAEMFEAVAANPPESRFGYAGDWLGEIEDVSDAVLRRFPLPPPFDSEVAKAKRLARQAGQASLGTRRTR